MHEIKSKEIVKKLLGPLQIPDFIPKKSGIVDCACLMIMCFLFLKLGYNRCIVKLHKATKEEVWQVERGYPVHVRG